jgi:four helix bundle protein
LAGDRWRLAGYDNQWIKSKLSNYKTFKELDAWKKSRELVKLLYLATASFPKEEEFGLKLQIRRAAISVVSNIAEGYGRQYKKETIQFIFVAKGSLNEIEAQLMAAEDLNFLQAESMHNIYEQIEIARKLVSGFINYLEKSDLK